MNRIIYKNENRYSEFLSVAKSISKKISKIEGVVGILATGGIARGYCDDYSDLDLIVYADDKVEDLFVQCRSNWKKVSEKTKYYLSW